MAILNQNLININKLIQNFQLLKEVMENTPDYNEVELYMKTNPYNPHVVEVTILYNDGDFPEFEQLGYVENLTDNTQAKLLAIADKVENGRFW